MKEDKCFELFSVCVKSFSICYLERHLKYCLNMLLLISALVFLVLATNALLIGLFVIGAHGLCP